MAYHNNITQAVQKALQAYLQSQDLSDVITSEVLAILQAHAEDPELTAADQVYTSILDASALVPNMLCRCKRAQGRVTTEGNWVANARIELRENAHDVVADDHFDRAGALFALFRTDTIATDLSAALTEFTAFQVVISEQGWDTDGRLWVSYLDLEIECCGSDIS